MTSMRKQIMMNATAIHTANCLAETGKADIHVVLENWVDGTAATGLEQFRGKNSCIPDESSVDLDVSLFGHPSRVMRNYHSISGCSLLCLPGRGGFCATARFSRSSSLLKAKSYPRS